MVDQNYDPIQHTDLENQWKCLIEFGSRAMRTGIIEYDLTFPHPDISVSKRSYYDRDFCTERVEIRYFYNKNNPYFYDNEMTKCAYIPCNKVFFPDYLRRFCLEHDHYNLRYNKLK